MVLSRGNVPRRANRLTAFALLAACSLSAPGFAPAASGYPAPRGYVNDYAGAMNSGDADALSGLLAELDRKADAQVAVAVMPDIGGADVETYAVRLFEKWGIGKRGRDRGALLLVALAERAARIEVGYGLESVIPDGKAGEILRARLVPALRENRVSEGISEAAAAMAFVIAADRGIELTGRVSPQPGRGMPSPFSRIVTLLILMILIPVFIRNPVLFMMLFMGARRGGFGGGFGSGGGGFGGGLSGGGGASVRW